ncbi:MAG: response regulator transcription factor [Rikenellaceae bacterium]
MKNILLIDDDMAIGSLLSIALQENGFNVHFQSSMSRILEVIKDFKPNLIILDVEVGDKNSIDSLPEILKVSNSTPVIFISSHHESELIVDAVSGGGLLYLKKPFSPSELIVYAERYCCDNINNKVMHFGDCALDVLRRYLTTPPHGSPAFRLGRTELKVLRALILAEGEVVSRDDIVESSFEVDIVSDQSVNNIICRLRQYLSSDKRIAIKTIHGTGYSLCVD